MVMCLQLLQQFDNSLAFAEELVAAEIVSPVPTVSAGDSEDEND
jgi:hypothetical protein